MMEKGDTQFCIFFQIVWVNKSKTLIKYQQIPKGEEIGNDFILSKALVKG